MYTVIKRFTDLQDNSHRYNVGDEFPREGGRATKKRLAELSGSDNRRGEPLIEEMKDGEPPEEKQPEE